MERDDRELWEVVQDLALPLLLTDLVDFKVVGATEALLAQLGIEASQVIGKNVFELFEPKDQIASREALQALADGTIGFYRAQRRILPGLSTLAEMSMWVHAIDFGPRHYALSEISLSTDLDTSPLINYLGYTPSKVAIGVVNHDGIVTSVSSNVENVINVPADALIGKPLLRKSDHELWTRLHGGNDDHRTCMVSWPYQPLGPTEPTEPVTCLLACLVGSDPFCFSLIRTSRPLHLNQSNRAAELEQRLWRIAQEVQASGILAGMPRVPDFDRFPQLGTLSTRQWEVLTRLVRGERVATIASELYVSESTVRNYLSAIFAKFSVHSQAELLDLFSR